MACCGEPVDNIDWRVRTLQQDVAQEVLKATPAIAGTATAAMSPDQVTAIVVGCVTVIYVVLQTLYLLWKWRREARRNKDQDETDR